MDEDRALRALRLFNEKADEIDTRSFSKQVFSERIGHRLSFKRDSMQSSRFGPDAESIAAFSLTLRYFLQDNEPSSFRNLSKVYAYLHGQGIADRSAVDAFEQARAYIPQLQRAVPSIPISFNGREWLEWEIFEVFFWGGITHSTQKEMYDTWRAMPLFFPMVEHIFVRTSVSLIKIIGLVRPLNADAIITLESRRDARVAERMIPT